MAVELKVTRRGDGTYEVRGREHRCIIRRDGRTWTAAAYHSGASGPQDPYIGIVGIADTKRDAAMEAQLWIGNKEMFRH